MSLKQASDLVYAFRFVRLLTTKWEDLDAYKLGIIDKNGDRIKSVALDTTKKREAYTPFMRLAFNTKRLLQKAPGGSSKIASFAAALYLIRENVGLKDRQIEKILKKSGFDVLDLLAEECQWFILSDSKVCPGVYRVKESKILNSSFEQIVKAKDKIRIHDDCYPVGQIFGINVYEATHLQTNQKIYVTTEELIK